jgi:hypothetical protein
MCPKEVIKYIIVNYISRNNFIIFLCCGSVPLTNGSGSESAILKMTFPVPNQINIGRGKKGGHSANREKERKKKDKGRMAAKFSCQEKFSHSPFLPPPPHPLRLIRGSIVLFVLYETLEEYEALYVICPVYFA